MSKVIFETTADGSHTLYVPELDEHYHSTNGAIQESDHIFIRAGLKHINKQEIRILEVGFGTGLNALLTIQNQENRIVDYCGFELYPLPYSLIEQLNYTSFTDKHLHEVFYKMHQIEWNKAFDISKNFRLTKIARDFCLLDYDHEQQYDLIYFDAFAPNKQEELWSQSIFDHLYSLTAPAGILVTYCAKGIVRRMLQSSGYTVERLPGPPGKREILRATKN